MIRMCRVLLFLLFIQSSLCAVLNDIDKERIINAVQGSRDKDAFSAKYKKALSFGSSSPFFFSQAISLALESNSGGILNDLDIAEIAFRETVDVARQQYDNADKIIKTAVTSTMLQTLVKANIVNSYQPSDMSRAILRGSFEAVSTKSAKVLEETMANVASGISSTLTIFFLQSKENAIPLMESISRSLTDQMYALLSGTRYWKQEFSILRGIVLLFTRDAILTATTTEQNTVKMAQSLFRGLYRGILDQDSKSFRSPAIEGISAGCLAGIVEASKLKNWLASTTSALISSAYMSSYDSLFSQMVANNDPIEMDQRKMINLSLGFVSVIRQNPELKSYHDQGVRYTIKNILYLMDVYNWSLVRRAEFLRLYAVSNTQAVIHSVKDEEDLRLYFDPLVRFLYSEILNFEGEKRLEDSDLVLLRDISYGMGLALEDPRNTKSVIKKADEIEILLSVILENLFSGEVSIRTLELVASSVIDGFLTSFLVNEPKIKASNQVRKEVIKIILDAWKGNVLNGRIKANGQYLKIILSPTYEHLALSVLAQNQRRPRTAPPISYSNTIQWIYQDLENAEIPISKNDKILFINSGIASGFTKQALGELKIFGQDFKQLGRDLVVTPFTSLGKDKSLNHAQLDLAVRAVLIGMGPVYSLTEREHKIFEHTLNGLMEGYIDVVQTHGIPDSNAIFSLLEMIADISIDQSIAGSLVVIDKFKGLKNAWLQFKNDRGIKSSQDPTVLKNLFIRAVSKAIQRGLQNGNIDKAQYIEIQNLF